MTFDVTAVRHAYDAIAHDYARKFGDEITTNEFDRSVIDDAIAALGSHDVVIDIGCGPGQVAAYLAAQGRPAVGLDLTPSMLAIARQQSGALPLVCADVLAMPLRGGVVGGVVAWYSLHNLPRAVMPSALSELRKALRPGGVLVIGTHGGHGEDVVQQECKGRTETVAITYYEPGELETLLSDSGFRVYDVRQRPPLSHEHQVVKVYALAAAR